MQVYLLHFDRPVNPTRPARHYLGSAKNLKTRLAEHRNGQGARLMAVTKERGIGWQLARTWDGDRKTERKLKRRKNAPRLCPVCRGKGTVN